MEGVVEFWGVPNWAPQPPMWCHSGAFTAADSFQSGHWRLLAGGPKRESGDTHTHKTDSHALWAEGALAGGETEGNEKCSLCRILALGELIVYFMDN